MKAYCLTNPFLNETPRCPSAGVFRIAIWGPRAHSRASSEMLIRNRVVCSITGRIQRDEFPWAGRPPAENFGAHWLSRNCRDACVRRANPICMAARGRIESDGGARSVGDSLRRDGFK